MVSQGKAGWIRPANTMQDEAGLSRVGVRVRLREGKVKVRLR